MRKCTKQNLLASAAVSALTVGFAGAPSAQQATAEFDLGTLATPAHTVPSNSADVGSILVQRSTNTVTGTVSGSLANLSLLTNVASDTLYNGASNVESNTFSSAATANITNSSVVFNFSPTTAGDTAVTGSYQSRIDTTDVTASVTASDHSVVISNDGTGEAILTGSLLVDDNDMSATATANNAISSITLSPGVNVLEDAGTAAQASIVADTTIPAGVDSDNSADILVGSAQVTSGATSVIGQVDADSDVEVIIESVDGATVTVSDNDLAAAANGNVASGSISSSDTTATITASAAVSNLQLLDITANDAIDADMAGDITVEVGEEADNDDEGEVDDSTITITGNTLTSEAEGSDSTQSISLVANAITGSGTADFSDSDGNTAGVQVSAAADIVAANTQIVTAATTVSADSTGEISLEVVDEIDGDIDDSTLVVSGNSITSAARAMDTSNSVTLQAGATMSATGLVGNVQEDGGSVVTARTINQNISIDIDDGDGGDVQDSTVQLLSNSLSAAATGARADNNLTVADGTNNLSLDTNTGNVSIEASPVPTTDAIAPVASAGFVVANDQARSGGSVTADVDQRFYIDMSDGTDDAARVTSNNDSNTASATAIGNTADNQITLNFNTLTGTIATNGDAVAVSANNQTLDGSASVSATTQNTQIVETVFEDSVLNSTVTASSNAVSAVARGNQTTNNDIVVDATNIVIADGVDASPVIDLGANFGDLESGGAFVSASVQEIGTATINATQVDTGSSTRVQTLTDGNISGSQYVSELNTLSVLAVGNEAANGVTVGTGTTSSVEASSASANVQLITTGNIDGSIGVLGSDASPPFTSTNSAPAQSTSISNGGTTPTNNGATVTFTFVDPLTPQEQTILALAGFTNITGTSADFAAGDTLNPSGLMTLTYSTGGDATPNTADDTLTFTSFAGAAVAPTLNNAGVTIVRGSDVTGSSLSVTSNTIAGEIRGNVATNTTAVEGTTVTATSSTTATTDVDDSEVSPDNASTVVANLQSVESTSDLDMVVAGTFAIEDNSGDPLNVSNSQQNVDSNLQQSYATANRATNGITIKATNSTADGVIENDQRNDATVDASSDLDLMVAVGSTTSTTSIDGNRNEAVANGNVESSTFTVSATNVSEEDGTTTDASVNKSTEVMTGDALVGTEQFNNAIITASATTDAFNEEINLSGASVDKIDQSTVSFSSNVTVAQATANNSTLNSMLGTTGTANYDASGAISALQSMTGTVAATTDSDVAITLNDNLEPLDTSTVNLNSNQASALGRGNVLETNLVVSGTNIDGETSNDAVLNGGAADNTASFILSAEQTGATVTANSSEFDVVLDLTTTSTTVDDATMQTSTATLSSNRSTASATVNDAENNLTLGAVGSTSTLTATGGLLNIQQTGSATATGGMLISADIDTTETGVDVVRAVAGSQLMLSSNVSSASATGNTAENTLTAVSTQITSGSADDANANNGTLLADASFSLLNDQASTDTVSSTNTANTVQALLTAQDTAVSSSTVTLSNNSVSALTVGNDAANTVSLGVAGTTSTLNSTGALVSEQTASGTKSATAGTAVTADIDSTDAAATALAGSTLNVSGNSSLASATNNNVLNTFSAVGTNMGAGGAADGTVTATDIDAAYALNSFQDSDGSVTATNTANTFTVDVDSADLGVSNSTVGLSSNTVEARATGNIAVNNSMGIGGTGTAVVSATGAINNRQVNSATVAANADSTVRASLDSSDVAVNAVSGSTVTVENNATTAMARGNVAQNVLNVTSAAATGGDGDAGFVGGTTTLTAAYGVLNNQTNSSAVTGTVASTTYEIALNQGVPDATVGGTGSTVSLSGNVADAIAYGNVATNSITLASLNSATDDATAMVASLQSNSGAISASFSGSSARVIADGAVSTSTVGVTGNAFRATAVGNYATSVVTRN